MLGADFLEFITHAWRSWEQNIAFVPALAGFPDGHITTRIGVHVTLKLTLKLTAGQGKTHHDPGTLGQF